jgi:hypothetical protein
MVGNSKQRFSDFLESIWQSSKSDVGLSGFMEEKVSSTELEVLGYDPISGFQYVGMEEATRANCGKPMFLNGCSDGEAHKGVVVDGVLCTGKSFMQIVLNSCDRPTCKVCLNSWKVRLANKIGSRLFELSKRFGKVEHITVSPPKKDYGLPFEVLRRKAEAVALSRGVSGNMIVHAFRGHSRRSTTFSIHFHVMGFVEGGFDRCRSCVHKRGDCKVCDGFKGRQVRGFAKDGYIVKVLSERQNVHAKYLDKGETFRPNVVGTLVYELGHATVLRGVKRFHVSVWFGKCAYSNAKVKVVVKKRCCPICGQELVKHVYRGSLPLSVFKRSGGVKECLYDTVVNDERVFVEVGSSGYPSSSVESDGG